jgi:hypothetical protein
MFFRPSPFKSEERKGIGFVRGTSLPLQGGGQEGDGSARGVASPSLKKKAPRLRGALSRHRMQSPDYLLTKISLAMAVSMANSEKPTLKM